MIMIYQSWLLPLASISLLTFFVFDIDIRLFSFCLFACLFYIFIVTYFFCIFQASTHSPCFILYICYYPPFTFSGINSLFLDIYLEAEGSRSKQKMGLVVGLTYSPHYTIKVLLNSQKISASGEGLWLYYFPNTF